MPNLRLEAKRELYATLFLPNFRVHRHIKMIPVVTCISSAQRPALLRTRCTNRHNPVINGGTRNVPLPDRATCGARRQMNERARKCKSHTRVCIPRRPSLIYSTAADIARAGSQRAKMKRSATALSPAGLPPGKLPVLSFCYIRRRRRCRCQLLFHTVDPRTS